MAGRARKKARCMNTRNRPSSTQEDLVHTDSESEQEVNATTNTATMVNKNSPPPLTQNTANAVKTLFLIKQEERHEFLHNSDNKAGYQALEDGTKVWGMTQEQREADNSVIEQECNENHSPQQQQQQQQQQSTARIVRVNPCKKPISTTPPNSILTIARNSTTAPPFAPTPATATTTTVAILPSPLEQSVDSDEDIVSFLANNLIEDDCMLFTEEERATVRQYQSRQKRHQMRESEDCNRIPVLRNSQRLRWSAYATLAGNGTSQILQ